MTIAKPVPTDKRIAHAALVILNGQRPTERVGQVDRELAKTWGCEVADVSDIFVEAWRRICEQKSKYKAVIMSNLDEVMRWDANSRVRVDAALAAWKVLDSTPTDPGPGKHEDRVAAYQRALRDPDAAFKEAMGLEGVKPAPVVDGS